MFQNFVFPLLKDTKEFLLDTFFPVSCLGCTKEGSFICQDCQSKLTYLEHQRCILCGKPSIDGLTHPGCKAPHAADGLISVFDYHDKKIAKLVIHGKYYFLKDVYKILGQLLAEKIKTNFPHLLLDNFALVPVPLYSTRRRWRGFNQAEILCQTIYQKLGLPITHALQRIKPTKTQKDLKKEARIKNVAGSFKLIGGAEIHGKNLILVDDVVTTGSTLSEAVKVLKRNGAGQVWCLTVARD